VSHAVPRTRDVLSKWVQAFARQPWKMRPGSILRRRTSERAPEDQMELLLFRHGDAKPAPPGGSDEDRELTERGRQEIQSIADALHRAGLVADLLFTSPLIRARQTAEIIQRVFGAPAKTDHRLRPGCRLGTIQDLVGGLSDERVVIVGHEPDMSDIVGQLTGGRVKFKTGGFARIRIDRVEPGQGLLLWLLSPETFGGR
jgi:phosphohistidine phosphatase